MESDPVNWTDSSGLIVDTAADIMFILYDLYRLISDGSCGFGTNTAALGADVGAMFIPGVTGVGAGVRIASKAESKIWKNLKPWRGETKTNGKSGSKTEYYEWDHTHGDIEVCNSKGDHTGTMSATTGEMVKPPVRGRSIDL